MWSNSAMFAGADRRRTANAVNPRLHGGAKTPTKPRFSECYPSSTQRSGNPRSSTVVSASRRTSFFRTTTAATRDIKALQNENIKKIHEFLVDNEGDEAVPEAKIRSPHRQDFINMFEMIYQHVSPNFEIPAGTRLEDLIPPMMREMGYPGTIKASAFNPMGVPHSWYVLLDVLSWLIDYVLLAKDLTNNGQKLFTSDDFEREATVKALRLSWLVSTYRDYTKNRSQINDPKYIEQKRINLRNFFAQQDDLEGKLEMLEKAKEQLDYDIEEIRADNGAEAKHQEDLRRTEDDICKAERCRDDWKVDCEQTRSRWEKVKRELDEVLSETQELHAINEQKRAQVALQAQGEHGITGERARQMTTERNQDLQTLLDIEKQISQISKETWLITPKVRAAFKEQQQRCESVVNKLLDLARGLNITATMPRVPESETEMRREGERAEVFLKEIRAAIAREVHDEKTQKVRSEQDNENIKGLIEMENEKIEEAKKNLHREERQRRREKEKWKDQRLQLEQNIDALENEKEVKAEKIIESSQYQQALIQENAELQKITALLEEKKNEAVVKISEKLTPMSEHLEQMECDKIWMKKALLDLSERC